MTIELRAGTVLPIFDQPLPPYEEGGGGGEGLVTETVGETV